MFNIVGNGRTETKRKIINHLLSGEKSLKELSQKIDISKQALLKHLNKMEDRGIVKSKIEKKDNVNIKKYELRSYSALISLNKEGFVVHYESDSSINFNFPLVNQIPQKNYRDEILEYLKGLTSLDKSFTLIIFGSVARGEATWKSDIDAAFISTEWNKNSKDELIDKISDLTMKVNIKTSLNPHFKTYDDMDGDEHLVNEIRKDGIIVYSSVGCEKLWKKMKRYGNI